MRKLSEICTEEGSQSTPDSLCPRMFASFAVTRYIFHDETYQFYLDQAEFAPDDYYLVGTLSVLAHNDKDEFNTVHLSELQVLEPVRSKVCEFLHRRNPDLYRRLVDLEHIPEDGFISSENVNHFTVAQLPLPDYSELLMQARQKFFDRYPNALVRSKEDRSEEVIGL
jgi:hypothetical protein